MTVKIQVRRGTAAEWESADPVLDSGEIGLEIDTQKIKIGDGNSEWTALDYFPVASSLDFISNGSLSATDVASAIDELDGTVQTLVSDVATLGSTSFSSASEFGGQVAGTYDAITINDEHGTDGVLYHHDETHLHDGLDASGQISHTSLTEADSDSATTDIHHTLGTTAFTAAAGNHNHGLRTLYTTSDIVVNNSTTLVPVTSLNIPVTSNQIVYLTYRFALQQSTTGAAGFKVAWSLPTQGSLVWAASDTISTSSSTTGSSVTIQASNVLQFVQIRAYYVGGNQSGNIALSWALNATTNPATTTTLKKGSNVEYIIQ